MSSSLQTLWGCINRTDISWNPPHEARRQLSWLEYCADNHRTCNTPWVDSFLPTRLIDVRSFPAIKLVDTNMLEKKDLRYIALSYCWGPSMPDEGKTLTATLESHQKGIVLRTLPKTLRDAIEVTRSLSFHFIWIDALCIIQDSRPDWEYELGTMAKIYSCAYVTIAAGVTDSCQGGFLRPSRTRGHLRTRSILPKRGKHSTDESWIPEFFHTPLFTRGWTLQERELSHRVIHFTSKSVLFECRYHIRRYEVATAHHYFFSMPPQLSNHRLIDPDAWQYRVFDNEDKRTRLVAASDIPTGMNWRKVWHRLVAEYSRRRLTAPRDRLPAIAGLAEEMQTRFGWTYVAGLWADNMPQELLWQRQRPDHGGAREWDRDSPGPEYLAPSWSWASANFPVWYNHRELGTFGTSIVEVLEVDAVPAGSSDRGELISGYIRIRAKVKLLQARSVARPMGGPGEDLCRVYDTTEDGGQREDLWIYWDRTPEIEDGSDVFVAVLMFRDHGRHNGVGLALKKGDDGSYSRVGLAWYIGHSFVKGLGFSDIVVV